MIGSNKTPDQLRETIRRKKLEIKRLGITPAEVEALRNEIAYLEQRIKDKESEVKK